MAQQVTQLYPQPTQEYDLKGLYLGHNLRQQVTSADRAFVYSNYVTSLDGRIAIPDASKKSGMTVPKQTANPRDWRLFQELVVQADILITTGRYLRDYAEGKAQEILSIYDDPTFADLKDWREERGLRPYPDLAVISNSLNFPIPDVLTRGDRSLLVFTSEQADGQGIKEVEKHAGTVIIAGKEGVRGSVLVEKLAERGYRTVYSTAGPKVNHLLLTDNVLDRLYLTYANRILGGSPFSSIVEGDLFPTAVDFQLNTLYHDAHGLDGLGQLFASYNRVDG